MPTLFRLLNVTLAIALLGGLVWLVVRTFPTTPAGWYWYIGELLLVVPAALLILHAGVQQCVPPQPPASGRPG